MRIILAITCLIVLGLLLGGCNSKFRKVSVSFDGDTTAVMYVKEW